MSDNTKIEWTEATWNPITGCTVVSAGCKNCYAMKLAGTRLQHHPSRAGLTIDTSNGPVWNGQVRFNQEWLDQPLKWKRPRMIFVCAHGDLFHESVPDEWIDRVFAVMALAPHHTFQVLTKRADRMMSYCRNAGYRPEFYARQRDSAFRVHLPLPNVWLGVSVENQEAANERIPLLLDTPAAVRWISAEPLLGPINLNSTPPVPGSIPVNGATVADISGCLPKWQQSPVRAKLRDGIDWVVAGGESGPNARPMHPDWARSLRDQCQEAGVAYFFKQWGEWKPVSQGGDWYDSLYKPIRVAVDHENQDALNEIYGRTCMVDQGILHLNGSLHGISLGAFKFGTGAMHMFKVGKKAAGRILDDRAWDEYPKTGS